MHFIRKRPDKRSRQDNGSGDKKPGDTGKVPVNDRAEHLA